METSRFLVNGEWRTSTAKRPVVNPYEGVIVGEVYQASSGDIEEAISAAVESFDHTKRLSSHERSEILRKISDEIGRRKEELACLITLETGKPISFSRVEVNRCVLTFRLSSEEAGRIEGTVLPLDLAPNSEGRTALVRRFPLGPISAITPFNFPLNLVAHKLGPSIASGNTVVLKPSSNGPLTSIELGRIVETAGYPRGGLNIVPCLAGEANQLVEDQRIKAISFTGSPAVGWALKARAGKKRVLLELGGNAGVIVDDSADLDLAMKSLIPGSYGNAGQSCIAVQRIFVHDLLYDRFLDRFVDLSKAVAVGDPMDEKTIVGPMITEAAAKKVETWISEAVAAGARLLCGGNRRGAMLDPTILVDTPAHLSVCAQEVFAPVVTIQRFDDFADAVRMVNDSVFGLQAGIFSNSLKNIFYAYEELEVGGVIVNDSSAYRMDHMPYGGVKDSGFGREGVRYAIEEMTEMKLLALNVS
ncbi:MAG: aldehyde dehydrogenase family protein [Bacteroidota bacterium]